MRWLAQRIHPIFSNWRNRPAALLSRLLDCGPRRRRQGQGDADRWGCSSR